MKNGSSNGSGVYIHGLRAENILGLQLVEVSFDGPGLTVISGGNGEGKSSFLRSIIMALAGAAGLPEEPVRRGTDKGSVDVDLGDLVVKFRASKGKAPRITVDSKAGATFKSPQALLDGMFSAIGFDPLGFVALSDTPKGRREQAELLRQLAGYDVADLETEHARVFADRAVVNKEVKNLEGQLAGIVVPAAPVEVGEERSPREARDRFKAAREVKAKNDRQRAAVAQADRDVAGARGFLLQIDEQIAALEKQLEERRAARERGAAQVDRLATEAEQARAAAAALVDPDLEALEQEQDEIEEHNRDVQARRALVERAAAAQAVREKKIDEVAAKKAESERLTARLEGIVAKKAERLAAAKFPVEGLGVEADTVTLDGLPLSQAPTSVQIRTCLAISAAQSPRAKFMICRQGNDLDETRLRIVDEWAREQGLQVLLERIHGDGAPSLVIEAGRVVADRRPTKGAPDAGADDFA